MPSAATLSLKSNQNVITTNCTSSHLIYSPPINTSQFIPIHSHACAELQPFRCTTLESGLLLLFIYAANAGLCTNGCHLALGTRWCGCADARRDLRSLYGYTLLHAYLCFVPVFPFDAPCHAIAFLLMHEIFEAV